MNYNNLNKTALIKEINNLTKNLSAFQNCEKIFFDVFDSLSDAVAVVDSKGNIRNANDRFKKLYGISNDKTEFLNLRSFKTSDGKNLNIIFKNLLTKNKPVKASLIIKNTITEADISVHEKKKKEYLLVLKPAETYDTDEIKLALDNPVISEFLNKLNVGMAVLNSNMEIIRSNNKMKEYFPGLKDDKKYICFKFYNVPPKSIPCDYCPVIKTFKDGKNYETITETPTDKGLINFKILSFPLKDRTGKVKYVVEMTEDITEKIKTDNKLREQLHFTEYLIDSIPIPVIYKDISGKYIIWNNACSDYFSIEKKDVIGKTASDIYKGENEEKFRRMELDVIRTGKITEMEFSAFHRKKKEEIDIILTKAPFYGSNGKIDGVIGVILDISERKKNERALQEQQEYIHNLIDTANIIIINMDLKGNILLFNKRAEEVTGYKSKEVIGKNYFETIVPKKKYPYVYDAFLTFLSKEIASTKYMENVILTKRGQERLISWRNSEVKRNGSVIGILSFGIDITDVKESEKIIKNLSRVVEQTSDLMIITDVRARIQFVNPAFTSATGYTIDEVKGKTPSILKSGKMNPDFYSDLWKTISAGKTWYGEFLNKKKNGELYYQYGSISPIKDNEANITNYIAIYSDISSIKKAQEDLESMKSKVEESVKMKQSLLSHLNFEYRTPLISILGFTEILKKEIEDEWQKEILNDIRTLGRNLLKSLTMILKLTQLETGEIKPNIRKIELVTFTKEIADEYMPSAKEKGLEFLQKSFLGEIIVQGDPLMLREIIENLLENAVRFTDKGYIKIEFDEVKEDDKSYALIKIKDSGKGIPKNKLDLIFGKFVKGDEEKKETSEGPGLGLTISSYMAKLMNGKISVTSSLSKGSEFILHIPLLTSDNLKYYKSTDKEKYKEIKNITNVKPGKEKTRLLLVEDNLSNINIVEIFLSEICTVESVTTGEEALKMIQKKQYDIIVMDINLGQGMNGVIAAKEILKIKKYGNIPIIAVTGYALYSDREKLLSEGFTDYLAKPFTKQQLINLILKYVKKR